SDRGGHSRRGGTVVRALGMGLGAAAPAGDQHGLVSGKGISLLRLARLQRGDDGLHPRPRLADARYRSIRLDSVAQDLSLGRVLRTTTWAVPAAVGPSIHAVVHRLQRHSGR